MFVLKIFRSKEMYRCRRDSHMKEKLLGILVWV